MMPNQKRIRILSLDGGSRGPLMVQMLRRLHEKVPGFLESVDIFTGTSAGSMTLGVLLTAPSFAEGLEAAEEFWKPRHFPPPSPFDQLMGLTGRFAMLPNRALIRHVTRFVGEGHLNALRKHVIIPAFSLDNGAENPMYHNWTPRIFHNLDPEHPDAQDLLRDVILRSSSAPIVSPVYQGHIDGGVFANNPSLCAICLVMDEREAQLDEMEVLSIGMGQNPIYFKKPTANLGYGDWLLDREHPLALLNAVAESNLKATNYQCGRLLRDAYFRLDPRLPHAFHHKPGTEDRACREMAEIANGADVLGAANWLKAHGWQQDQAAPVIPQQPQVSEVGPAKKPQPKRAPARKRSTSKS